jgi:prepilin-type N-terminal cleavage/methylation domain-containing protein
MLLKANKALNDRRAGLKREEGFTLIELLVVVIIIGILAAIAIPIYIGVQNSAKDSAVKTDLANAKIAVITYFTENPSGPTPTLSSLTDNGYTKSSDTTAIDFGAATTDPADSDDPFCIEATSSTGNVFHVTDALGVADAACA